MQARATRQTEKRKAFKAGSSCASQHAGETLDDDDIFDDDAPLLSTGHMSKTHTVAYEAAVKDRTVSRESFQVMKEPLPGHTCLCLKHDILQCDLACWRLMGSRVAIHGLADKLVEAGDMFKVTVPHRLETEKRGMCQRLPCTSSSF